MLFSEEDLKEIELPKGPRVKILRSAGVWAGKKRAARAAGASTEVMTVQAEYVSGA